jgi:hypothetical protein
MSTPKESEMVEREPTREEMREWFVSTVTPIHWNERSRVMCDAIRNFLRAPALVLSEGYSTALEIVLSAAEAYVMQVGYRNVGRTTEAIESLQSLRSQAPAQGVEEAHEAECHGQGHEFKDGACMFCGFAPQPPPPVASDGPVLSEGEREHIDDFAVTNFAIAMRDKLAKKRDEGRAGWDNPLQCNVSDLATALIAHVKKGDPVDVANFAMMLHFRVGGHEALRAIASRGKL